MNGHGYSLLPLLLLDPLIHQRMNHEKKNKRLKAAWDNKYLAKVLGI
ncbi:hypothetical protein [Crocosphaera chwakensis]|nr:hypothetical protein [Crocosphaera chwakensis]